MRPNPHKILKDLKKKPESFWLKRGEKRALKLFREMAERVPAYKDFLKKNRVDPEKILSAADLKKIPSISKDTYLRAYPLEKLMFDGIFDKKRWIFSVTSGSTGKPYYFPRQKEQDDQYALTAELYLLSQFEIDKKSTLYINGFAMGAWIGGLFTYQAIKLISDRGNYPLSIINPGLNKTEILNALESLGKKFEQVIIGGYPPFVKDVLDEACQRGIALSDYNLRFIFSAEAFSETFRDYIAKKAGLKNPLLNTLNHYGTVDMGTMAHETPLSILIRRIAVQNTGLYPVTFKDGHKLPTLAQFLPELFYFEEEDGKLFCSAKSGIPLMRYDLKDNGGVFSLENIKQKFLGHGRKINLVSEAEKAGIGNTLWNLPFVYVYERNDFSVSLYGGNVYPENIRNALQETSLENEFTGKFTMLIKNDEQENQRLEINAELKHNVQPSEILKRQATEIIVKKLLAENSEYRSGYSQMREKLVPNVILWPYEHPSYFHSGGKQKWVKK